MTGTPRELPLANPLVTTAEGKGKDHRSDRRRCALARSRSWRWTARHSCARQSWETWSRRAP